LSPAVSIIDNFVNELEGLVDLLVASGGGVSDVDLGAKSISLDELPWLVVDRVGTRDTRHVVVVDSLANLCVKIVQGAHS
jgi:hypothetical protein